MYLKFSLIMKSMWFCFKTWLESNYHWINCFSLPSLRVISTSILFHTHGVVASAPLSRICSQSQIRCAKVGGSESAGRWLWHFFLLRHKVDPHGPVGHSAALLWVLVHLWCDLEFVHVETNLLESAIFLYLCSFFPIPCMSASRTRPVTTTGQFLASMVVMSSLCVLRGLLQFHYFLHKLMHFDSNWFEPPNKDLQWFSTKDFIFFLKYVFH